MTNPSSADGGIGGTGAQVATGGVGGTGAPLENGGIGGTGTSLENGGVGGTGAPVAKGGGIGGTGDSLQDYALLPDNTEGEIGIMGVVTGFASICVNGEEVHYDAATPVYDNGQVAKLANLAVGKTVMLKADNVNGKLQARAIGLFHAVSGPVQGFDKARQQMRVMGQNVQVNQDVMNRLAAAKPGAVVSVSGHRLGNGTIAATRVDVNLAATSASTLGLVTDITPNGFSVNGTRVNVADKQVLQKVSVGTEVSVAGSWTEGALKAASIQTQPIKNVMNRVNTAIVEGFARQDAQSNIAISGTELSSSQTSLAAKQLQASKDKLVKVELHKNNRGDWVADNVSERKGRLFDKDIQFKDNGRGNEGSNSGRNEGESSDSDSSRHGSSGSSGSSGHGSSGSSGHGSSGSSGHGSSGSSGSSRHGSSGSGGRSSGGSGSSGSSGGGSSKGSGSSSGGKGSGKYK